MENHTGVNEAQKILLDGPVLNSFSDTATYKYTIKSGDNGKLWANKLVDSYDYKMETEDGTLYTLSVYGGDFTNTIYADTTIKRGDFSNAKFEIVKSSTNSASVNEPKLKMSNVITIGETDYYIYLSHNKNESFNIVENKELTLNNGWNSIYNLENNKEYKPLGFDNFVAENGEIYIWICELDKDYKIPKILVSGAKVERMKPLPLGSRMKAHFFSERTSTYCWEPYGDNERKVNLKIGTISDISILKAIRDGESECLNKLLEYAKNADSIYTGKVKLGDDEEITSQMDLVDDAYYYVYLQMDDENGKYYPTEDVSLYQALVGESVGKNLFDYLDDNFKWNISEESETKEPSKSTDTGEKPVDTTKKEVDTTTAKEVLPYTGKVSIIAIAIMLFVSLIFAYYKTKKYKDIN